MSDDADRLLDRIPGQYIAEALKTLRNAEKSTLDAIDVVIDVPNMGAVRITANRMKHKKGRSTHYFWNADRADSLSDV
jgi:hypothetical protein